MPRRRRPSSPILSTTSLLPPTTLTDNLPLPKLLIFDLDYTLWPFWADTHPTTPLHAPPSSQSTPSTSPYPTSTSLTDKYNIKFTTYEYTPILLHSISTLTPQIPICLASRTESPNVAEQFLRGIKFVIPGEDETKEDQDTITPMISYITHKEIYPARSKLVHFSRIEAWWKQQNRKEGGGGGEELDWRDVIFFDDESRNRDVERKLGVFFCLVDEDVGVSREVFDRAIWEWRRKRELVSGGSSKGKRGEGEAEGEDVLN